MSMGKWLRLAYVAVLPIWLGLWATIGAGNWWMASLSHAVPFLFTPSLLVLFAAPRDKPRRMRWLTYIATP
jgi:hypothetical protein